MVAFIKGRDTDFSTERGGSHSVTPVTVAHALKESNRLSINSLV